MNSLLIQPLRQMQESDIDIVVAASRDAIVMVEGGASEAGESDIIDALLFAQKEVQPILDLIERMRSAIGKEKRPFSDSYVNFGE